MVSSEWMARRFCDTASSDLFHPRHAPDYAYARELCEVCPVQTECLDYELAWMLANPDEDTHGMWGGSTPPQRRRMLAMA